MSIAAKTDARVQRAVVTEDLVTFYLKDGRVVNTPLSWSWRLSDATPAQRENYEIIGDGEGVHWPDIDETSVSKACSVVCRRGGPGSRSFVAWNQSALASPDETTAAAW